MFIKNTDKWAFGLSFSWNEWQQLAELGVKCVIHTRPDSPRHWRDDTVFPTLAHWRTHTAPSPPPSLSPPPPPPSPPCITARLLPSRVHVISPRTRSLVGNARGPEPWLVADWFSNPQEKVTQRKEEDENGEGLKKKKNSRGFKYWFVRVDFSEGRWSSAQSLPVVSMLCHRLGKL